MGLDQYFYKQDNDRELVEVGYFRKNWELHKFINDNIRSATNSVGILLNREELDRIVQFLIKNPTSDIFTYRDASGELQLSNTYVKTILALSYYQNLIYSADF